jgi:plastocyanin
VARRGLAIPAVSLAFLALAMALPGAAAAQCQPSDVPVSIVSTSSSNDYSPDTVNVPVGGTACWTNNDPAFPHTATADAGGNPNSPSLDTGETYRATFTADATIPYHCAIHPNMTGTVRVGTGTPPGGGGGGGQTVPGADTAAPRFSGVRVIPARACAMRSRTCARPGARVRFRLDERARVTGALDRRGPGGSRVVRRFSFSARAGPNSVRLPLRRLRPGHYRLALRAVDAAGNRSAVARASFRLRR